MCEHLLVYIVQFTFIFTKTDNSQIILQLQFAIGDLFLVKNKIVNLYTVGNYRVVFALKGEVFTYE